MRKLEPKDIHFFSTPAEFNNWLKDNHKDQTELWVGFHKVHTDKPSMTWSESVDEALCYGWIDGIRKTLGKEAYTIRFTPRKKRSNWSAVNLRKMEKLVKEGRMRKAGLEAFRQNDENKANSYSYERDHIAFSKEFRQLFKKNKKAWEFFESQPPSYKKPATHWVMSAKREETRERRLLQLMEDSEKGLRIKQLRRP